jgi:hypothetical protein
MLTPSIRGCWHYDLLQPLEEIAPRQQDTPVTSSTAYANIRPDAVHDPFIAAARVRFLHLHAITHANILIHS